MSYLLRRAARLAFIFFSAAVACVPAEAASMKTIYTFTGGADGLGPNSGLVAGPDGALYGSTSTTVYKLTENAGGVWQVTAVVRPSATVRSLVGTPTALYAVQAQAGKSCQALFGACGVVLEMIPPPKGKTNWTSSTIYEFSGGQDGANPSGLALGPGGALFGVTSSGGGSPKCGLSNNVPRGCGTLFKLAKSGAGWSETILHRFQGGSDGALPMARPSFDTAGDIFLTTNQGGATAAALTSPEISCDGYGALPYFKTDAEKVAFRALCNVFGPAFLNSVPFLTLVASFGGMPGDAPSTPQATTELSAAPANTAIFTGAGGGQQNLCSDLGNNGCGVVALLTQPAAGTTPWTLTTIHEFGQDDGAWPYGRFLADGASTLYGVTWFGGDISSACFSMTGLSDGCGVIYKLTKGATGRIWGGAVHKFSGGADGAEPVGELRLHKGAILGVATAGAPQRAPAHRSVAASYSR
jgi:hypothetical protein